MGTTGAGEPRGEGGQKWRLLAGRLAAAGISPVFRPVGSGPRWCRTFGNGSARTIRGVQVPRPAGWAVQLAGRADGASVSPPRGAPELEEGVILLNQAESQTQSRFRSGKEVNIGNPAVRARIASSAPVWIGWAGSSGLRPIDALHVDRSARVCRHRVRTIWKEPMTATHGRTTCDACSFAIRLVALRRRTRSASSPLQRNSSVRDINRSAHG